MMITRDLHWNVTVATSSTKISNKLPKGTVEKNGTVKHKGYKYLINHLYERTPVLINISISIV